MFCVILNQSINQDISQPTKQQINHATKNSQQINQAEILINAFISNIEV